MSSSRAAGSKPTKLKYRSIAPGELEWEAEENPQPGSRGRGTGNKGVIDRGAFGSIKKATWNGKAVAVKYYHDAEKRGGLREELTCLLALQGHHHIVTMHGAYWVTKDQKLTDEPYIVLEYASTSLKKVLHDQKDFYSYTADNVMNWAYQLAAGLEFIHSMGWMHRDIKPSNILLFDQGCHLKLCDFGTTRKLQRTVTNFVGTIRYMAPEVIQGCHYSTKCDVFSYGLTMWEIIAREEPTLTIGDDAEGLAVVFAVANNSARPRMIRGLPRVISEMITRCWHQKPEMRPDIQEVRRKVDILCQRYVQRCKPLLRKRRNTAPTNRHTPGNAPPPVNRRSLHTPHSQQQQLPRPIPVSDPRGYPIPRPRYPLLPNHQPAHLSRPGRVLSQPGHPWSPSSPIDRGFSRSAPVSTHQLPHPGHAPGHAPGHSPGHIHHSSLRPVQLGRQFGCVASRQQPDYYPQQYSPDGIQQRAAPSTIPASRQGSAEGRYWEPESSSMAHGYVQFAVGSTADYAEEEEFIREQQQRYQEMQRYMTSVQPQDLQRVVQKASPYLSMKPK